MPFKNSIKRIFELSENVIYIIIGILLVIAAAFVIFDSILTLFNLLSADILIRSVIEVIDKSLLLLMIIEILYTVKISIQSHTLYPEPFLIVALIAGIRRILLISVEIAYIPEKFELHLIEMGVIGVLILIFVSSIILLRKYSIDQSSFKKLKE